MVEKCPKVEKRRGKFKNGARNNKKKPRSVLGRIGVREAVMKPAVCSVRRAHYVRTRMLPQMFPPGTSLQNRLVFDHGSFPLNANNSLRAPEGRGIEFLELTLFLRFVPCPFDKLFP